MSNPVRFFLIFICTAWLTNGHAMTSLSFQTQQQEQQYYRLINEIRCLVCQNQNIADSSSSLAQNLRAKTYDLVVNQHNDDEIRQFMSSRYGDYILYAPPVTNYTIVLWLLPFVMLLASLSLFIFQHWRQKGSYKSKKPD